jgi:hypothetical protein
LTSWISLIKIFWAGGVAQAIEHLLTKCEALSSNPSTHTKKKKERRKRKNSYYKKDTLLRVEKQTGLDDTHL